MSKKEPKFLRFNGWKKNPKWVDPNTKTLDNIVILDHLVGNVHAVSKTSTKHRKAYRDTMRRLALAAHRAGYGVNTSKGRLYVSSSYRTKAEQTRLYSLYKQGKGALAAVPGTSAHERGLAVDVPNARTNKPLIKECHKLGLKDDVASEIWHLTNHAYKAG